jgi:hypothetical protein
MNGYIANVHCSKTFLAKTVGAHALIHYVRTVDVHGEIDGSRIRIGVFLSLGCCCQPELNAMISSVKLHLSNGRLRERICQEFLVHLIAVAGKPEARHFKYDAAS